MSMDGILRLRIPQQLMDELAKRANGQMLTTSAYVRLVLAQHVGLIEPPNVLVDTREPYISKSQQRRLAVQKGGEIE